jgi:type VI secretion system secreted protein VgrG
MADQIPGNRDIVVRLNDTLIVTGDSSVRIGRNSSTVVQDNQTVSAGKDLEVTAKNVTVRGADSLELVCGAASILLKKDGTIVIRGRDIMVDGSGKVSIKSASDAVIKGVKIQQN